MTEKFCLKWNDFETNVSKSFGLLRNEDYLHDVTLVCDDNKQVSAHKLVMSACSDFFKSIFKNNKHLNPLICLQGVSSQELENILDYMYNGETNIFQESLDKFLSIAQRFEIIGLLQNDESKNVHKSENDKHYNGTYPEDTFSAEEADEIRAEMEMKDKYQLEEKSNYVPDYDNQMKIPNRRNNTRTISLNVNDANQQADELIETLPDGSLKCTHCGKLASKGNLKHVRRQDMRNHAETHLDGLSFECQLCGKTFRSRNSFRVHQSIYHKTYK